MQLRVPADPEKTLHALVTAAFLYKKNVRDNRAVLAEKHVVALVGVTVSCRVEIDDNPRAIDAEP